LLIVRIVRKHKIQSAKFKGLTFKVRGIRSFRCVVKRWNVVSAGITVVWRGTYIDIRGVTIKFANASRVKVIHTSLVNTTVVAFKVLPLGSYAPMPVPSPPLKTILELVLWNGLQSCRCITPDVINVIKMPSFQYFLYLRKQKKVIGG